MDRVFEMANPNSTIANANCCLSSRVEGLIQPIDWLPVSTISLSEEGFVADYFDNINDPPTNKLDLE